MKQFLKFSIVLITYGFTFATMVQFGLWLADLNTATSIDFQLTYKSYTVYDWACNIFNLEFNRAYLSDLGMNIFLIFLFVVQHTYLSSSYLQYTKLWAFLHSWGAEKPIYNAMTGFVLQILMNFWKPIPVEVWSIEVIVNYFKWVHVFGWALLYGTSVMLDLPDMVGLTQVAICSPTITAKSPDLQQMYQRQRHMGLVPFLLIFGVFPYMSLDRFVLSTGILCYTFCRWRSDTCYDYAKNMKQVKRYRVD